MWSDSCTTIAIKAEQGDFQDLKAFFTPGCKTISKRTMKSYWGSISSLPSPSHSHQHHHLIHHIPIDPPHYHPHHHLCHHPEVLKTIVYSTSRLFSLYTSFIQSWNQTIWEHRRFVRRQIVLYTQHALRSFERCFQSSSSPTSSPPWSSPPSSPSLSAASSCYAIVGKPQGSTDNRDSGCNKQSVFAKTSNW